MEISYTDFIEWPRLTSDRKGYVGSKNFSAWCHVTRDGSLWMKSAYIDVFIYPMAKNVRYSIDYSGWRGLSHDDEDIALEGMLELIRQRGVNLEGYTYDRL